MTAPDDFDAAAERTLNSLANRAEADWVAWLALTPRFDLAAASHCCPQIPPAARNSAWEKLQSHRGISATDTPGWYTLQLPLRNALRKRMADSTKRGMAREAHLEWRLYWRSRAKSPTDEFAALSWYHRWVLEPRVALVEWDTLAERARSGAHPDMELHYLLLDWWFPVDLEQHADSDAAEARISIGIELANATMGDKSRNLERAIACYEAALRYCTEARFPSDWATIQNNMGAALSRLPDGDRGENLERAIACYESVLRVYTEAESPMDWAMTQHNLGLAYRLMPTGDRARNLQHSIDCYEAALRVRTEADNPRDWAMTHENLAVTLEEAGDRTGAREAMEYAIAGYIRAGLLAQAQAAEDWLRDHP